jgi:putative protein kinase ArgK-like GTPase of G3E family
MASRGHLGGLALGVKGVVRVMGLIGCDVIFIETVGVGQSEVEVAAVADLVMIVMAPGQGDGVQLLKAGLMEVGDLFVVNKADRPDAARLHSELLAMLRIAKGGAAGHHGPAVASPAEAGFHVPDDGFDEESGPLLTRRPGTDIEPRTFLVSAEQGQGLERLVDALEEIAAAYAGRWRQQRLRAVQDEVRDAVLEAAADRLRHAFNDGDRRDPVQEILDGRLTVREAAAELLRRAGGQ